MSSPVTRKVQYQPEQFLLAVMLLPPACLGETSVTAGSASESLFDDDEYYAWLYGGEEDEITGEELALANLLILWDYNSGVADWCRQEADKLPENSETRKEYKDFAVILQNPMPDRPTEYEYYIWPERKILLRVSDGAVEQFCPAAEEIWQANPALEGHRSRNGDFDFFDCISKKEALSAAARFQESAGALRQR